VIAPAILPGAFERDDVDRLLDHADQTRVTRTVGTHQARIGLAEVAAPGTEADALLDRPDRLGQTQRVLLGHPQQVHRQTLCALLADARELGEFLDQQFEVLRAIHGRATGP